MEKVIALCEPPAWRHKSYQVDLTEEQEQELWDFIACQREIKKRLDHLIRNFPHVPCLSGRLKRAAKPAAGLRVFLSTVKIADTELETRKGYIFDL